MRIWYGEIKPMSYNKSINDRLCLEIGVRVFRFVYATNPDLSISSSSLFHRHGWYMWYILVVHTWTTLLYVMFTFPTRIFYWGFPGFATDCPNGVWCRGLTTCLLYVGPLFENLVQNNNRFVSLTYGNTTFLLFLIVSYHNVLQYDNALFSLTFFSCFW